MNRRKGSWLLAVTAALVSVSVVTLPAHAAPNRKPTISLATHVLRPGRTVALTGHHWPQGTAVQFQLCGRNAVDGSADCALDAALTVSPGPTGQIDGLLVVKKPPRPCPCVVLVQSLPPVLSTAIPVTVVGARTARVRALPAARFDVQASVSGGTSWRSLLGLGAHRELRVSVTNRSRVTLEPVVSARWGRVGHEAAIISAPPPAPLGPGQTRTIVVPFTLSPLSFRSYSVAGSVLGGNAPGGFQAGTSTVPWGLVVILVVLLQMVLLKVRNRVRARLPRESQGSRGSNTPESGTEGDLGELFAEESPAEFSL